MKRRAIFLSIFSGLFVSLALMLALSEGPQEEALLSPPVSSTELASIDLPLPEFEAKVVTEESTESMIVEDSSNLVRLASPTAERDDGLTSGFDPQLLQSRLMERAQTNSFDTAEWIYERDWSELIDSFDLSDTDIRRIRDMIIRHEAHNLELTEQARTGEINASDLFDSLRPIEDLLRNLSLVLSENQISSIAKEKSRSFEQFQLDMEQYGTALVELGYTDILAAANLNDLNSVVAYLNTGSDPNARTTDGKFSALHMAAIFGNAEMAQALVEANAEVNWASQTSNTSALELAAFGGHTETVDILIAAGADLEHFAISPQNTALRQAANSGNAETVRALLEAGADATGEAGEWALYSSIDHGNTEMENLLLNFGANDEALHVVMKRAEKQAARPSNVPNNQEPRN